MNQTPYDMKFSPHLSSRMIPKSPVSEDAYLRASTKLQQSRNLGIAASEHMHGSHSKQTPREEVVLVNTMCNSPKEHSSCCVVKPFVPAELNKDVSGTDAEQSSSESFRPKNIVHDILKYYKKPSMEKEVIAQSCTVLEGQHGEHCCSHVHSSVEENISMEVKEIYCIKHEAEGDPWRAMYQKVNQISMNLEETQIDLSNELKLEQELDNLHS